MNTYTMNMIRLYKDCPKAFFYCYKKNISIPSAQTFALEGKRLHALINFYLKGFNIEKLKTALNEKEAVLFENFCNLEILNSKVIDTEFSFNVKLDEFWLAGRCDALFKKDEKFVVADWKTGKLPKKPDSDLQTIFYLYSIFTILKSKNLIKNEEELSLVYFSLKSKELAVVDYSPEQRKKHENILKEAVKMLEADSNFDENAQSCAFCAYKKLCD